MFFQLENADYESVANYRHYICFENFNWITHSARENLIDSQ